MTELMTPELSRPFLLDHLGQGEKRIHIVATPEECAALAGFLDLVAVQRVDAMLLLKRRGAHLIRVAGTLEANVVQRCVVTLAPVPQQIQETFEVMFTDAPPQRDDRDEDTFDPREIDIDYAEEDPPDLIEGGMIDLGVVVAEHLALALDPFPRAEGAEFAAPEGLDDGAEAMPNPFAALAALKRQD